MSSLVENMLDTDKISIRETPRRDERVRPNASIEDDLKIQSNAVDNNLRANRMRARTTSENAPTAQL